MHGKLKKNGLKSDVSNSSYAQIAKVVTKALKALLKRPKKKRRIMYVDDDSDSDVNSSDSK